MNAELGSRPPTNRPNNLASTKRVPCPWNKSLRGRVGLHPELSDIVGFLGNNRDMTEESEGRPSHARRAKSKKPTLSPEIQKRIGRQLQDLYVGVVQQGFPDRFTELLRRLDAAEASSE